MRSWVALLLAATVAVFALALWSPADVVAHGREVDINVTPLRPDPDRPLTRLYYVVVTYRDDGDAVEGATVVLTAVRQERGDQAGPLTLTGMQRQPGVYVGELTYERFGTWEVELDVSVAFGQGEGSASFSDAIVPLDRSAADEERLQEEAARVVRLQAFFGFDWWPDVMNVVTRALHSAAGLTYFAVTGLALFIAWNPATDLRRLTTGLTGRFTPLAGSSLAVLLAAGVYGTIWDAPVLAPGLFDLDAMTSLPYGEWYLAAFAVKPILFVVLVVLAVRIGRGLRALTGFAEGEVGGSERAGVMATLRRDTALNALAGAVLVIDLAFVIYLHYVSHLGVFLPS